MVMSDGGFSRTSATPIMYPTAFDSETAVESNVFIF